MKKIIIIVPMLFSVCVHGQDTIRIKLPGNSGSGSSPLWTTINNNIYNTNLTGSVGIGTVNINDLNYKLFVETGIRTRKIKVDQINWPDYVFHLDYQLPSLKEIETFIQIHNHLPDVPSVSEVEKNGIDLGDSQAILLKKIEELTLYAIEQNKRIEDQAKKIAKLEMSFEKLASE